MTGQREGRIIDEDFFKFVCSQATTCKLCGKRPAQDPHHFGDGGMGMKGSDYLLVRLCRQCHAANDRKVLSLKKNNEWELLTTFYQDATNLMQRYIQKLRGEKRG